MIKAIIDKFQFQTGSIKRLPKSHKRIIQNPYGPCQVIFFRLHFQDGFAVDLRLCNFPGGLTALDRAWV